MAITTGASTSGVQTLHYRGTYYTEKIQALQDIDRKATKLLNDLTDQILHIPDFWEGDVADDAKKVFKDTQDKVSNMQKSIAKNIANLENTKGRLENLTTEASNLMSAAKQAVERLSILK